MLRFADGIGADDVESRCLAVFLVGGCNGLAGVQDVVHRLAADILLAGGHLYRRKGLPRVKDGKRAQAGKYAIDVSSSCDLNDECFYTVRI